jgi:molybdate transport system permease protein
MTPDFWSPILLSLKVTLAASLLAFLLALPMAALLSRLRFRGQLLLETLLMLPLVLPPTVIGFGLLVLFGRNSWPGRFFEWLTGAPLVFSYAAAVLAAAVVAFPLVFQTLKTGFQAVDPDLQAVARSLGASEWQVFRHVTAPLSSRFLLSSYLLGFARALGEFGATLMFAGNIPHKTQTLPTAIYLAVESGRLTDATLWVLAIITLSFLLLILSHRLTK